MHVTQSGPLSTLRHNYNLENCRSDAAAKGGESDMVLTGDLMRFTIPVNMAGLPAISLLMGHDCKGKPCSKASR